MKILIPLIGISLSTVAVMGLLHAQTPPTGGLAHVSNAFEFTVHAPLPVLAPLFGAHGERVWAGDEWNPQFLYPQPEQDVEGAVFTVTHGGHQSTWVNTVFDLEHGHMAYAYFIPGALATRIDVRLAEAGPGITRVHVLYERTALSAEANAHVRQMGAHDAAEGEHWRSAIEKALTKPPAK